MKIIFHYDCGPWLAQRLKALINDGMDIAVCAENDQVHFAELLPSTEVLWHVLKPVTATHIETATNLQLIQKKEKDSSSSTQGMEKESPQQVLAWHFALQGTK